MITIEEEIKTEAQTPENSAADDIKDAAGEAADQGTEEAGKEAEDAAEQETETSETEGEAKAEEASEKAEQEDESTRYMRLMADFQNYKKRVAKEKTDLYQYANEKIVTELLAVLDNFERALEQEAGDEGFKEGMQLIFKQLTDVLEKSGLAEIAALGEDFDPNLHNAVMTEASEEYESGKVSGVLQKGYTLNGKVIRPTMVKVVG
ncbi:MAG: nucleotide exchange factor GrpE [Firmicutes bacterium]|nr:nucleotide exchange factor GrpE [Bacillota bacterium]